ncbi:MAG: NAD(P)-dependent alcohol dehydrogenase [Spirochaetales bacterium]
MDALVLEKKGELEIREIEVDETIGPRDVRIALRNVGVCGSDVHYYTHGAIGPFVVNEPMILGHEASGVVVEVGTEVQTLQPGDRVCMEPGVPNPHGKATRLGMYNLDPEVSFWATPPVHGVTRPTVVHPEAFTFKLPDNVSFAAGAMVEPLAVGMHAATKAGISPGDVAVVIGAGTIGLVTIMSALAGGCSRVISLDIKEPKLELAKTLGPVTTVNVANENARTVIDELTEGWGADIVFEASGAAPAMDAALELLAPGGTIVAIGMPLEPIPFDLVAAQAKEARLETIFRYAHVYPRALALMGSGAINLDPLVTERYPFAQSKAAYEYATDPSPESVKIQIEMPE